MVEGAVERSFDLILGEIDVPLDSVVMREKEEEETTCRLVSRFVCQGNNMPDPPGKSPFSYTRHVENDLGAIIL